MDISHILNSLNDHQRKAVTSDPGNLLVLAGAGSGKTRVLVHRIAWLIQMEGVSPHGILAVTFTNKAANEMRLRIEELLERPAGGMWVGTFHGLAHRLLRAHYQEAGLPEKFQILDSDDQLRLVKRICKNLELDESKWPAKQCQWFINNQKDEGVRAANLEDFGEEFMQIMIRVYSAYEEACDRGGMVDFGELLLRSHELWLNNPALLEHYQSRFRHLLVDEFQDTNAIQYAWLRMLVGRDGFITVVGDDDQSIYGWRGAEVGNILRFETDFPGAKVVRLEQNYRSTPHILAAASGVIAVNQGRLGKTLWTDRDDGEKLRLIGHYDGEEEARWIGDQIEDLQRGARGMDRQSPENMAILVRASHQMRAFEDRFLTIGMPYRVIGGPRFYERLEIRDAMAYFRLAVSGDDDLAFERVINTPKRGLGDKAQQTIQLYARASGVSLFEGAKLVLADGALGGKGALQLQLFVEGLTRWQRQIIVDQNSIEKSAHIVLAEVILDESGYTGLWMADKTPEAAGRLDNLKELVKALEQFENLQGFLEHVSLVMENETEDHVEKVSIMTLHAAKGLEFPVVFLPGWEDGLFPSQRSMDETGQKGVEEERRLAYVGITRAEMLCTISFAANRRVYGQWQASLPSRFIDELPPEHVDVLTPPGLYGGAYGVAGMNAGYGGGAQVEARAASADVYNSPGWKRLQGYAPQRKTPAVTIDAKVVNTFALGQRIFHEKFGYGSVVAIDADKLDIAFEKAGTKKVVARFVVLAQSKDVPF